jgi:hypothetical protein
MEQHGRKWSMRLSRLAWGIPTLALGLFGCDRGDTHATAPGPAPEGHLVQKSRKGPISFTTTKGWRIGIEDGAITVKPPEGPSATGLQYVSQGTRERLGTRDLRAWAGDRRSILLPDGAKITLHGQSGALLRLSLYDGDESHEIDVLTQTIMHSKVDGATARNRDEAEYDGETGHLVTFPGKIGNLYLANLYVQNAGADGVPLKKEPSASALGRQVADSAYAYSDPRPEFPPQTEETCDETPQPRGGLVQQTTGKLEYTSRSGRWIMTVDQHTITLIRKIGSTYQVKWEIWGDPHENLNGKHVKDWEGRRRTLLLDDGTKITMDANGPDSVVQTTSIYDGAQSHEIGNTGNKIRHSCVNAQTAAKRDAEESDGETAYLVVLRSPASVAGGLLVENIYTETAGTDGESVRTFVPVLVGETGEADLYPNLVNDFYDAPGMGHT